MPDRAVCAISEDRTMVVALDPHPMRRGEEMALHWSVIMWNGSWWEDDGSQPDTGQDAHEVLREWLEGREA